MLSVFKLGGYEGSKPELAAWLKPGSESGFVPCEDEILARFLNGLIIQNRGPKGDGAPEPESVLTNNMMLQKLKIALNLQAADFLEMLKLTERPLSKHELSALFRRPDNKHYRECPDTLLASFLDGMEKRCRNTQA